MLCVLSVHRVLSVLSVLSLLSVPSLHRVLSVCEHGGVEDRRVVKRGVVEESRCVKDAECGMG